MMQGILNRILHSTKCLREKPGGRCLDESAIASLVDSSAGAEQRAQWLSHLARCSDCRHQVAAVAQMRFGEEALPEVPPRLLGRARGMVKPQEGGARIPFFRWGAAAAAAASAVLVIAVTYRQPRPPVGPPVPRPGPAPEVAPVPAPPVTPPEPRKTRNLTGNSTIPILLFPKEGGIVGQERIEFRWQRVPSALSYDVLLLTEDGDVVWDGRAEGTSVQLPDSVHLAAGALYYVRVSASLPEGKTVSSRAVSFKTKRPG